MTSLHNQNKLWFSRRLTAAWIDSSFVYFLSLTVIHLADRVSFRIPLESVFLTLAVFYGTINVAWQSSTFGKILLSLVVVKQDSSPISFPVAILREAIGKWLICLFLPLTLARFLIGRTWIPTILDLVVSIVVVIALLIHLAFVRRPIWDIISGTTVLRKHLAFLKTVYSLILLLIVAALGITLHLMPLLNGRPIPSTFALFRSTSSTARYVAFLEQPHLSPKDYVFQLFDKYDIVVLCERYHEEKTQWDFIFDIVNDPRFASRVGHVFTEYGNARLQPFLDDFMAARNLSDSEIDQRSLYLMRNFPIWPIWNNRSFYDYLRKLYRLNQTLSSKGRIRLYFCDDEPTWDNLRTREDYQKLWQQLGRQRDKIMANTIIKKFNSICQSSDTRKKALIIMNYRHAFGIIRDTHGEPLANTASFLMQNYLNKVANILLNTNIFVVIPIQQGIWDAAFTKTGNKPMGFSFANTPFGSDAFDLLPYPFWVKSHYTYTDVFTGFVFLNALDDQSRTPGIANFYRDFEDEAIRRVEISQTQLWVKETILRGRTGAVGKVPRMPHTILQTILEVSVVILFLLALPVALVVGIVRKV